MYYDAVIHTKGNLVVFNGPSDNAQEYLLTLSMDQRERCHVFVGKDLETYTVEKYFDMQE